MTFKINTEGYSLKFAVSMNQLIINLYDYEGYREGQISIIVNSTEKNKLIKLLEKWKP